MDSSSLFYKQEPLNKHKKAKEGGCNIDPGCGVGGVIISVWW